jgi:hypothetical protein
LPVQEQDPRDPPDTTVVSEAESESQGGLLLPALLGVLCAVAIVAALFGLTLLAIWWRG